LEISISAGDNRDTALRFDVEINASIRVEKNIYHGDLIKISGMIWPLDSEVESLVAVNGP
jgi:hypothetical protein